MRLVQGLAIFGTNVDSETRCEHWHSHLDVIAIRFKCCAKWYPCFDCHAAIADHDPQVWPADEFSVKAVLCGVCGHRLAIDEYLSSNSSCPKCGADFNPCCARHYDLYFEQT